MLDAIRRHTKGTVGKIVLTIAISLLILSFAVWGISDIFRGRVDTSVARVGRISISSEEFQRAVQRQVEIMRESLGPDFDREKARALGIDDRVMESLIRTTVLDLGADELRLTVPDDELAKRIREVPAFRGPLGTFDRQQFMLVLRENGYTEERFVESMRRDSVREQLLNTVSGGIRASALMTAPLFAYLGEQRTARYLILPSNAAGQVPAPTADQLHAYYEAHKESYRAPEYRSITYIALTTAALASRVQVSEQELREHFEANRNAYGEPERRTVLQLVFNSQEEANLGRADIKAGKSFEDVAQAQGRTTEDLRLESKTLAELAVPLGEDGAKAAFALAPGEVSAPVKGRFGWLLLKAESILPARAPRFEEARDKIREEIINERASEQLFEVANSLEDARASGASLEEAANAASVGAVTLEALDAEGKDRAGVPIPGLMREIVREAFSQDENFDADLKPLPNGGYFVVRVNKISPSAIRPFEEVRDRVAEDALREERGKRLAALTESLAERVERGTSLDAIAKELGLSVHTSDPLQRGTSNETFSREVVEKLFATEIDDVVWGPVGLGESMLLLQLTNIRTPDAILDQAAYDSVRDELSKAIANDAEFALSDALQEQFEVRINARALEQVSGEL